MSKEERILEFIRREGPMLPNRLGRFLGTDLIIAGAHLSELSAKKKIFVTSLKIGGGSPVYYLPGQEEKLQIFRDELNGKDRVTFDLLKEKKILRDKDLDALTRVSLRNIIDFAKPLEVNLNGEKEIFWKWYLVKNEEVTELIKTILEPQIEEREQEVMEEIKKQYLKTEKIEQPKTEIKREVISKIKKTESNEQLLVLERPKETKDDFFEKVKNYLNLKNIKINESEMIRKTEINLILSVPTAVGEVLYYCKAKAKKKCNDKDVSSAFLEGQMKKLPMLFLYSGEITKKTEEMLGQDIFKNLILLHLD